mgnify:CR=1 FL=1
MLRHREERLARMAHALVKQRGAAADAAEAVGSFLQGRNIRRTLDDLQDALDAAGVPFALQGELLALLAPMHRDIVTR